MLFLITIHEPTVDVESVLTRSYSVKDKILFFHVTLQYNKGRSLSLLFMWPIRWTVTCFIQSGVIWGPCCKKNGPLAHLLWILVFDDQHNQIGLMSLASACFVVQ
jgi:hypothetical protein